MVVGWYGGRPHCFFMTIRVGGQVLPDCLTLTRPLTNHEATSRACGGTAESTLSRPTCMLCAHQTIFN